MAQKVQVVLVDDVDGSTATETVSFGLDGVQYEVDLNDEHAAELRDALAPWMSAGRRIAGRRGATPRKTTASSSSDAAEVRAWAKANGVEVPERGRIPAKVREAFEAAK